MPAFYFVKVEKKEVTRYNIQYRGIACEENRCNIINVNWNCWL